MSSRRGNIQNGLDRLAAKIKDGNYYEAHQLIKLLAHRYTTQNKFEDAAKIYIHGAQQMLEHQQYQSGSDLTNLLIKLYDKDFTPDDEKINVIISVFNSYPPDVDDGKVSFMKSAIRWSLTKGTHKQGDPKLHLTLAKYYSSQQLFGDAHKHWIRSDDPKAFAEVMIQYANEGYPSEKDLYIARAVLQYLILGNLKDANIIFDIFCQKEAGLSTPLINFLRFLLQTLERDAYPLFTVLKTKYKISIERDPSFSQYLDQVGLVFFNQKPQDNSMSGMFSNILQAFLSPGGVGNEA
eukprot:TRINITY_DN13230_c0_g1_i1.p1 TRINITY_DN13230_c0_g1~~TRINITY_DN13230_c0_g1_i1.p1  ORF type:complete len:294 (-),score=49.46 TRINITY_DN13230_c0_g1_i1:20-901(-)